MAEYAVFLYDRGEDPAATPGNVEAERAEHDDYSEKLQHEGVVVFARALAGREASTSIRADGITDGPFLDAKEVVLGFYVITAADLDEAIAIARRNPILHQGGGLEIRPIAA